MNIFIFIMLALLSIGVLYSGLRLLPRTSLSRFQKILVWCLLCIPFSNAPLRIYVRSQSLENPIPVWVDTALFFSYLSMGALSLLVTVLVAYDLYLLGAWITKKVRRKSQNPTQGQGVRNKSRRAFMQNALSGGLATMAGGLVLLGSKEALALPQTKHIRVPIVDLPKAFHGFKIVQLTDLHINKPFSKERLEKIVDAVHALKPDCIVITGDVSDSHVRHVKTEIAPLGTLSAKDGVYFVTGNHEYYTNIHDWLSFIAHLGITNLDNEHRVIERQGQRLLMCGVPDIRMSPLSDPIKAQEGSRPGDIKILLAHQPQNIYEAVQVPYDLQISGHTHGGQFFPWTYVTDMVQPYIHGLYKVEKTHLYVSRGTGYWGPPLRIGAPAEITLLELLPQV